MNLKRISLILFHTTGGRVLLWGMVLTLFLLGLITYYGVTEPAMARTLGLVFAAHSFGGRAAAIGFCMLNEMEIVWTIAYNLFLEIQIVCIFYALFVLSIQNHIHIRWVNNLSAKMMNKAVRHSPVIQKYGWIGLFVFVMIPLPVTGPVMGSILGYLLYVPLLRNFSAVFLGTLCAIGLWVFCFDFLNQHLHLIQYVLFAIISFVILSHINRIKKWFYNR